MLRTVHFEIHADDPKRAMKFYKDVFGWTYKKWITPDGCPPMDYWLVMTGKENEPGIDGGLMKRKGPPCGEDDPISTYYCTIDVPSVDKYIEKIKEAGGKIVMDKHVIAGVGWMAALSDTEGNRFGIMQNDTNAK